MSADRSLSLVCVKTRPIMPKAFQSSVYADAKTHFSATNQLTQRSTLRITDHRFLGGRAFCPRIQ